MFFKFSGSSGFMPVASIATSENFEGWSDNLTELYDDNIGDNHPIDVASREFCIYLINKYLDHKKCLFKPFLSEICGR